MKNDDQDIGICEQQDKQSAELSDFNKETNHKPVEIDGFLKFYLFWSIPLGILVTIIGSIVGFDASIYGPGNYLIASDVSFILFYCITGAYVIYAFLKCRSDAVFMAKYQLFMLLFSNLTVVIFDINQLTGTNISGIIWSIVFFVYLCFSDKVKDRIPKKTRKLTKFCKYFFPISIIIPIVCFLIGSVEAHLGYSLFADTDEKMEQIIEQANSTLPEGQTVFVEGRSVVYEFDSEIGEASEEKMDLLSILYRENYLTNIKLEGDIRAFFTMCVEADYNIVYKYKDKDYGTCITVTLTPNILSQLFKSDHKYVITQEVWDDILNHYNAILPILYFPDCYLENISINNFQNTIRYDLRLINISVEELNSLSKEDFEYYMYSNFESFNDEVLPLIDYCGYDIEYSFTADCLSWWNKSIVLKHDKLFQK